MPLAKIALMNSKQQKTLETVYAKPTAASLEWSRIESLFVACGCVVIEGRGSRVRFAYEGHIATFHRPHPTKEAKSYQVESVREFLELIGVKP